MMEFKHGQAFQHLEKGQHLERLGRMDEAMVEFKRAVEADPSVASAHNALGHHYQRKGLLTKASDEFRIAALLAGDYESYFNLGRALSDLERFPEAEEAFRRSMLAERNDPGARYELAFVECAQGRYAEGLKGFQALATEYPDDWELELAMANCYMGMQDYGCAEGHLRHALLSAPATADASAVREALWVSLRHLEFSAGSAESPKDRLYAEHGIVALGSGRDTGLNVPLYEDHTFTYRDLAVSLCRLLALMREYGWQPTALVGLDKDSQPIAMAASHLLQVPVLRVDELRSSDFALVVMAQCRRPELCEVTLEHMPGQHLSFALAMLPEPAPGSLVDVIGVPCAGPIVLPWERPRRRSARVAAASLLRALAVAPEDDNLAEQMAYYTDKHKLLRFLDMSGELPPPRPA